MKLPLRLCMVHANFLNGYKVARWYHDVGIVKDYARRWRECPRDAIELRALHLSTAKQFLKFAHETYAELVEAHLSERNLWRSL